MKAKFYEFLCLHATLIQKKKVRLYEVKSEHSLTRMKLWSQ